MIALLLFIFTAQAEPSLLMKNCDAGKASACFEYAYKRAVDGDQLAPLTFFEKGCDLKDGRSCYALDRVYKKLNQLVDDHKYLELSCKYSFGIACSVLGDISYKKKEYLKSLSFYRTSCDLKFKKACEKLNESNTYFSKIIRSNSKDLNSKELADQTKYLNLLSRRMKELEKECLDKKYAQCTELAEKYLFLANIKDARKWATAACEAKMAKGCLALGEVEQKEGKPDFLSFEKACDLELGLGCTRYAQSIESKNLARSMSFYRRACQAKVGPSASACLKYSIYQGANPKLAIKFKDLACKLDKEICKD